MFAPSNLPPMIRTDASNSFAHQTMRVRVPATLRRIQEHNPDFPAPIHRALEELSQQIQSDAPIPIPLPVQPDFTWWENAYYQYSQTTWLNTVWFFAETYFYRQVIHAVRWWETGRDPFRAIKEAEYTNPALWERLKRLLSVEGDPAERIHTALGQSLWGNRIDLSFPAALERGVHSTADDLLVDERHNAIRRLFIAGGTVHLIADNAGSELALDLALADVLLETLVDQVVIHFKMHPTFISDAIPADVWRLLDYCGEHGDSQVMAFRERIQQAFLNQRLHFIPNLFWNSSLMLWEMPPHLTQALQDAALIIVKGDANYRRVIGDAIWQPDTPFWKVADYAPAPLLALRTLKSDPVVGLPSGLAEQLDAVDPDWRLNGQRGIIEYSGG